MLFSSPRNFGEPRAECNRDDVRVCARTVGLPYLLAKLTIVSKPRVLDQANETNRFVPTHSTKPMVPGRRAAIGLSVACFLEKCVL